MAAQENPTEKETETIRLKRENERLTEQLRRLQLENEERSDAASVSRFQDGTINALQQTVEKMSLKIEEMEQIIKNQQTQQNSNHHTMLQKFVEIHYDIQRITDQTDERTILVIGGQNTSKKGIDEMFILSGDRWNKLTLTLPEVFGEGGGAIYLNGAIYLVGLQKITCYKLDKNLKWTKLADMHEKRLGISNSCLEWNESIWVFGGTPDNKNQLKRVECYDPRENKWIRMPDMKYRRAYAAAAVYNGRFIVCGGENQPGNYLTSVECFDPESGVWHELEDMPTPLYGPSIISDGQKLILMGGTDGNTPLNFVFELSNPEITGKWKQLPPMKESRSGFSAQILGNEIFVIGGWNGKCLKMAEDAVMKMYEAQAIAIEKEAEADRLKRENEELVDELRRLRVEKEEKSEVSSADRYKDVDIMEETITKLQKQQDTNDNQVLKRFSPLDKEIQFVSSQVDTRTILILGGQMSSKEGDDSMLILRQDKWDKLQQKLPKKFTAGGAVCLAGEIYIFSGTTMIGELHKLDKNFTWTRLANLNVNRWEITNSCLEWNGSIWVFGGLTDGKQVVKSVERYDPQQNKWIAMPDMRHARHRAATAVFSGKLVVCGGKCGGIIMKSVECFDPESGVWTELADMATSLSGHSMISYGNSLITIGGEHLKQYNSVVELSNLEGNGTWRELPHMQTARASLSTEILGNKIYAIGGWDGKAASNQCEIFDGQNWKVGPLLPDGRWYMCCIVIPLHLAESL